MTPNSANDHIFSQVSSEIEGTYFIQTTDMSITKGSRRENVRIAKPCLIAREMRFTYRRAIKRLYYLHNCRVVHVVGEARGEGSIRRLVGPTPAFNRFYELTGHSCPAANVVCLDRLNETELSGSRAAQTVPSNRYLFDNCQRASVGLHAETQGMAVSERTAFQFSHFTIEK